MTPLKQELIQFIASAVEHSALEKEAARHDIAALLLEEVFKLAKEDDDTYNQYVLKPLYKAQIIALKARIDELTRYLPQSALESYMQACKLLESCVSEMSLTE